MYMSVRYRTETKRGVFVRGIISSQSPIVYVKMGSIDKLEMNPGQIVLPCSQQDIMDRID